jgi:hypothetical protein
MRAQTSATAKRRGPAAALDFAQSGQNDAAATFSSFWSDHLAVRHNYLNWSSLDLPLNLLDSALALRLLTGATN